MSPRLAQWKATRQQMQEKESSLLRRRMPAQYVRMPSTLSPSGLESGEKHSKDSNPSGGGGAAAAAGAATVVDAFPVTSPVREQWMLTRQRPGPAAGYPKRRGNEDWDYDFDVL